MSPAWSFRWLYLYVLFGYINKRYVLATWPSLKSSKRQLLGIFHDRLNMTEPTSWFLQSRAMFISAILLSQQYNITMERQFMGWKVVRGDGNVMNTLSSTCQLISNSSIVGIVGPSFSTESHVIAPFAAKLGIPVISHAATDPDLSDRQAYPSFYRTVPADNTAALAIAKLFIKLNWKSCIIIYQDDAFGSGGAKSISGAFQKSNLTVAEMLLFDTVTLTIRGDLKSLLTSSVTRIIILWTYASSASLILQNALDADVLGPQFTWILSSNVALNPFNPKWYEKLAGMLTLEPVIGSVVHASVNTTLLNAAYDIWQKHEPKSFPGSENVNYYALFAFDAAWALIQSLQRLCRTVTSCVSLANSSYCFDRRFVKSSSLFDILNTNGFLGVTGPIGFRANSTDRVNGTYYVVRNVQSFSDSLNYVPVLVSSDSGDWKQHEQTNIIIWPGKSLVAPTGYAAISGVKLRIAVVSSVPFTKPIEIEDIDGNTTQKLTGYIPDLIELLQQKMGFIPIITLLPQNQSYNALIDIVANNMYDMIVGDVTVYATRREKVAFSAPIFDNTLRIVVRDTPIERVDFWSFLKPFSLHLWVIILGAVVWSAILLFFLEGQQNPVLRSLSSLSRLGMSVWYAFATLVGYGASFNVATASGRLLAAAIYIISFVLIAQYQANLTSDLTISKSHSIISGLEDLKAGKIPFSRIGIRVNTAIEEFYLREVTKGSRNFYPLLTEEEIFRKLLDNIIDAAIIDAGGAEYAVSAVYCNLTLVGTGFDYSEFAIVTQKNWIYQQVLDVNILSLRESGILDRLKNEWFQSSYCSHASETSVELPVVTMTGLFVVHGALGIIALLVYIIRPSRNRIKHRVFVLVKKSTFFIHRIPSRRCVTRTPAPCSISQSVSHPSIAPTSPIPSSVSSHSISRSSSNTSISYPTCRL